ncbi:putative phospholipid-binding lipoprotein MlaA precursor [Legionella massiliensis]|uniref:Putative phospholipid-binding lipoprotein MlaA n=1 Tax=Legionella massiliensis TaxID=1034943 RepID=A0A078KR41_9GAMM|nr:VacJ family lipoprotein [Legionella massiliensis]CDZ76890.1 putative phospholipid-binding lipoprotein MlaA precursor [Legionella massiliensis]CEE12628.1 putative phospholipid-binding lipoprotein MlaA precursor [Legionella massiliensis]
MRLLVKFSSLTTAFMLSGCIHHGTNPSDPYEPFNRKIYKFNMVVDKLALRPAAKLYKAVLPSRVRSGINNAYNNVYMLPTAANDVLQGEWRHAIKDSWRFLINSTFGVAGIFDVANQAFSLPPHFNDLGLTFAKWGDKKSPYIMLPLLGPSTIRDGMSIPFDYMFTPYPYLPSSAAIWGIAGLRYVDLRSQLLETDPIMDQALDKYAFMRDAYLQHRNFLITGEQPETQLDPLYVDEGAASDYVDEEPAPTKNKQPKANGNQHVAYRLTPAGNSSQHR